MNSRSEIISRLRAKVAEGRPIIGGGAGTGLSAKCSEAAGLDFIVVYNSGRYRMAGRSSMAGLMPYGDANAIVMEMGSEILPVVDHIPVVAGVCGTDPFRIMAKFLRQVKDAGFSGVQNYPTVCLFDGIIRANLEETGLGFDREAAMIAEAHALDLFTATYVANPDEAEDKVALLAGIARAINPEVLIVCHGGPIFGPDEAAEVIRDVPGVHGFLGASSMERMPTEIAMVEHMTRYTQIPLPAGTR
jgi:predicted TIM-barrel enzyme